MAFDMENDFTQTSAEKLLALQSQLESDLRDAVLDGNAEAMIRLDAQIRDLSARIYAEQIAEIKNELDGIEQRKIEIKAEIAELESIRAERNRQLARAVILHEERLLRRNKVDVALYSADGQLTNLLERRRELKNKLDSAVKQKMGEIKNEKFITI